MNVKYRDVRYIIPFLVQRGLYASPVGYSSSIVPEQWRLLYSLNRVVGVIDGFCWCILGKQSHLYLPGLLLSVGVTIFLPFKALMLPGSTGSAGRGGVGLLAAV